MNRQSSIINHKNKQAATVNLSADILTVTENSNFLKLPKINRAVNNKLEPETWCCNCNF